MHAQVKPDTLYWWSESMGRFELQIPGKAIEDIFRPGPADSAVAYWATRIKRPVEATVEALRTALREYGAWDDEELADDAANWHRVVWCAACDLGDSSEPLDTV